MGAQPATAAGANAPTCVLCGRVFNWRRRRKPLYGVDVCGRCRNAFANRRQLAYIIDGVLWMIPVFAIGFVLGFVAALLLLPIPNLTTNPVLAILGFSNPITIVLSWGLPWLFLCKDGFNGMSPGKWLMGVQVVDRLTREPIGFWQSFKRNLILMVPVFPLIIALSMMSGKRLGDGWANTAVIWRKHRYEAPFEPRGMFCHGCGYNLTGNVSGRCPECGLPVPARRPAAGPTSLPNETA